jgi:hypothetical protein
MVKPLSLHGKRVLRSGASGCYIKAKASQLFDKNVIRFRSPEIGRIWRRSVSMTAVALPVAGRDGNA